jgi:hypothetical protein
MRTRSIPLCAIVGILSTACGSISPCGEEACVDDGPDPSGAEGGIDDASERSDGPDESDGPASDAEILDSAGYECPDVALACGLESVCSLPCSDAGEAGDASDGGGPRDAADAAADASVSRGPSPGTCSGSTLNCEACGIRCHDSFTDAMVPCGFARCGPAGPPCPADSKFAYDDWNCGSCGHVCDARLSCVNGVCSSGSGAP